MVTRVPDIVVTLAMAFVWAGCALLVLNTPGGGSAQWLKDLVLGPLGNEWIPKAAVVLIVIVAVDLDPAPRSRLGLSLYAIGSNQLAAFRSGVSVGRTKIVAYVLTGLFAALGGLSLTASTGIGTPVPGPYTLLSVAAIVLGGVSLAGGRGGVFGPIVARRHPAADPDRHDVPELDPNLAMVAQGVILIGVVMLGSLIQLRRSRAMTAAAQAARPNPWLTAAAGGRCSAIGRSSRCSCCSACSSSLRAPARQRERRLGRRHLPRRRAAGHPRRLPDAGDADRRDRPVGRRGRLDGGVRRRHAGRRAWACRSAIAHRARAAALLAGLVNGIGVGVFRVHPLIMTLGMSLVVLGLANVWQVQTVQTGAGVAARAPHARVRTCS